ncbi:MAG: NifB/NifX family molybdenum-iron cluster-binding protein [Armatimonadota bacterium]|nr:MAG: NifB/NifX family molybdenum-iron cluster-binding protein [Armatimonadota bacterium]
MKVAVTSSGPTLDSEVDPRFGRAQYLLIVNTETLDVEPVQNPNVAAGGGAGVQAAQMVVSKGAEAVLTGGCGPNAYRTLHAANVKVYAGVTGSVSDAVEAFKRGQFSPLSNPSVPGDFGTRQASDGDADGAA